MTVTPAATQKRSLNIIPADESAYEHQRERWEPSLSLLNKRGGLKNGRLLKSFFSPRHESIVPRLQNVSILSGHLYSSAVKKPRQTKDRDAVQELLNGILLYSTGLSYSLSLTQRQNGEQLIKVGRHCALICVWPMRYNELQLILHNKIFIKNVKNWHKVCFNSL